MEAAERRVALLSPEPESGVLPAVRVRYEEFPPRFELVHQVLQTRPATRP